MLARRRPDHGHQLRRRGRGPRARRRRGHADRDRPGQGGRGLPRRPAHFAPGQLVTAANGAEDLAVSGALWWSASNWRNRITVPLTFAPLAHVCDVVGHGAPLDLYGSELLAQATEQWAPAFCPDPKLFRFKHVQTGEPQARNLLAAGTIDGGLHQHPAPDGYSRPVVHAPVAVTGFAIAYRHRRREGQPVHHAAADAAAAREAADRVLPGDQRHEGGVRAAQPTTR